MNHKQFKHKKHGNVRCIMSNKIANGREVILVSEAINYVKKIGYKVIPTNNLIAKRAVVLTLLLVSSLNLLSAIPSQFVLDLAQAGNQVLFYSYFALAMIIYFFTELKTVAGFMVFMGGVLILANQYNLVISMFVILLGALLVIRGNK